jgi:hypothetical protein
MTRKIIFSPSRALNESNKKDMNTIQKLIKALKELVKNPNNKKLQKKVAKLEAKIIEEESI